MKPDATHRPHDHHELPRFEDRLTFVYLEHTIVDRDSQSIAARDHVGTTHIPCANLNALLLGPGATITQAAVLTLADHGCTIIGTGEHAVRCYATGVGMTRSTRYLERHVALWANPFSRARTARALYSMRFPGEDVAGLSVTQLRGREGARVRRAYRHASRQTGIPWTGRNYSTDNWGASDDVNKALSAANTCLYGICHAAISLLGCSPDLGFIHTGKTRSFVFDLADLYKADTTIPIAFEAAARVDRRSIDQRARHLVRDYAATNHLLERVTNDLRHLLFRNDLDDPIPNDVRREPAELWDPDGTVRGGKDWGRETEEPR